MHRCHRSFSTLVITMKLTQLSLDDFERLAGKTEMETDARTMAKGVLVYRRSLLEMAAQFGVSKQRVHQAVELIRKVYAKSKEHDGLFSVELELPHVLAVRLEQLAAAISEQNDSSVREAALAKLGRAFTSAEHLLQAPNC